MAEPIFDAPIPGSSLTREIESLPYKNPPKYNTVEDAIDFYIERMSTEEFSDKLVNSLKPLHKIKISVQKKRYYQ
jgi:hypothetical protein